MDPFIIAAVISAFIVIGLSLAFLRDSKVKNLPGARPRPVQQRDGAPGRVQAVRNQRARMRANARNQNAPLLEEDPREDEEADAEDPAQTRHSVDFDDKMGAKKRAKLEAKQERKAAREAEEHLRRENKLKEQQREEERKKLEEKQEMEEAAREEAERAAAAERARRDQLEYEAMRAAFTVEEQGFDEQHDPAADHDSMLQLFIQHIKSQKVVVLEELAARFRLKTAACIERVSQLQASGDLTGVIDDRGKFIYISRPELEAVALYVRQRGRVSIADLARCSNDLINLNPPTPAHAVIEQQ